MTREDKEEFYSWCLWFFNKAIGLGVLYAIYCWLGIRGSI